MVFEFLMFKFGVRALIGGLIVAVTCASLGVFIVLRRLSLIADGLGHVAFGGIALGFWTGLYPLYTAVASVIAGALGIHALGRLRVASDAAIAILFSGGLAIGIVLISLAQSAPGDLLSYLFGTILGINDNDVYLAAGLGVIVLLVLWLLWKEWVAITLDPDFARVAGMPVTTLEVLFTVLVGLTVVVATRLVGVLLVSSLMVIPAIAAIQLEAALPAYGSCGTGFCHRLGDHRPPALVLLQSCVRGGDRTCHHRVLYRDGLLCPALAKKETEAAGRRLEAPVHSTGMQGSRRTQITGDNLMFFYLFSSGENISFQQMTCHRVTERTIPAPTDRSCAMRCCAYYRSGRYSKEI